MSIIVLRIKYISFDIFCISGRTRYLATGFADTETNVAKVTIGLYKGMWAYDGWNNLNYVTEELVNPFV